MEAIRPRPVCDAACTACGHRRTAQCGRHARVGGRDTRGTAELAGRGGSGAVTPETSHADWLARARSSLRDADPVLARLIDERPDFDPRAWLTELPAMDLFGA